MTDSDRPGDRPWPAPTGDADWWRGDGGDFPVSPTGPAEPGTDTVVGRARRRPRRPRPAAIMDAELVELDSAGSPDLPPVSAADPVDPAEVADPVDSAEVVDGEFLETAPVFDGSPRPFDAAPRAYPRPELPPALPDRPAAPAPMLGPVPAGALPGSPCGLPSRPGCGPGRPTVHAGPDAGLPGRASGAGWPGQRRSGPAERAPRPIGPLRASRRPVAARRPWLGLPSLVVLALLAAFFGWVSAEPFWLAVGHGQSGTATVVASPDRCRATFVADGAAFTASTVDLSGVLPADCRVGASVRARMVSADASRAYAVSRAGLAVRVGFGYGLVLLCGVLIAWATGAARFRGWRRAVSITLALTAPAAIAAALLPSAY